MDDLKALLGQYSPQEPPEIVAVKRYILQAFNVPSSVGLRGEAIIITVSSASLANALRMHIPKIKLAAGTDKRIVFRIG